jgi:uncharacterized membrane protein YdjX (TVP38/TMEM64 family)
VGGQRLSGAVSLTRPRFVLLLALIAGVLGWAVWSYRSAGLVSVLLSSGGDSASSLDSIRDYVAGWGRLGPAVYVCAVVVEVIVAPIPGTLLYAPGGAIFGGFLGGTLSLAGNVIGATIACLLTRAFGERMSARLDASAMGALAERIRKRGVWVVALLRLNPFTSSDLVSYAAGLVRVPVWHVTVGTLLGMAPLCYAQAYLAAQIFSILPGSAFVVVGLGLAYVVVVVVLLMRR